ncbi:aspartic-type endopeptidase [Stagonosporopsis vannaccii]|nr:aspartic-type endopeptidase [Stagonosporopsis vannaccii]
MACPNGSVPLILPWTNNSVSAAGTILSRGISFSVGTPPQPFSLTPSTLSTNLFLNSAAECVAATNSSCIGQLGGVYDSATSTSFAQVDYSTWGGSRDTVDLALASSYVFFDDAVTFGLEPTTNKFSPFPIYTNGSTDTSASPFMENAPNSKATLPLGMNSTFLHHLVDSAQASSRTYGLWVGSESEETPQDGLLVIGGYDESRLSSAATTFPMFSDCPTCAILTAITYDVGGKSTSLFSDTMETLIVNLDPFSSDLELPTQMLQNLASAEKTAVWNETSRRFELPATTAPVGTLTITISDAGVPLKDASKPSVPTYKTVIPAGELYSRPRAYNAAGVLEVNNATVYNMAVTNQTNSVTLGTLGLPFFTQNYLVVDPDARNFQLAPAVVTPADPKGADAKIKQVCRILPITKQKSQAALLAGAIVGAILGTLLLVGLVLYIRKRKQNVNPRHSCGESEAAITTPANPLCERTPTQHTSENKSLELPPQAHHPSITSLRDNTTSHSPFPNRAMSNRSMRSDNNNDDPRRGLIHDVFQKVDEENDGRLLDERPMGLSETIHSSKTLPRMAAEHKV